MALRITVVWCVMQCSVVDGTDVSDDPVFSMRR